MGRAGAAGVVDNAGLAARVRGRLLPGVRQPVSVARADRGVGAAERDARHLDAVWLRPAAAERRHHRRRVRAAAVGLRAPPAAAEPAHTFAGGDEQVEHLGREHASLALRRRLVHGRWRFQFLHAGSDNRSHEGTSTADEAGAHRDPARAAKQHLLLGPARCQIRRTSALAPCPLPSHRPTHRKPHAPCLATAPRAASSTAALRAAGRTAVSRTRSGRAGSTASSAPPGGPPPPHPLWMPAPAPSVASGRSAWWQAG